MSSLIKSNENIHKKEAVLETETMSYGNTRQWHQCNIDVK